LLKVARTGPDAHRKRWVAPRARLEPSAMKLYRGALLVVGLGLLATAVGYGVSGNRSTADHERDRDLAQQVAIQSRIVEEHFDRARTNILITAQNPAFRNFYRAPGTRDQKIAAGGPLVDDVTAALSYLETLYPTKVISEVCFIHVNGAENARVVGARIAEPDTLSQDETGNPFFGPTMRLERGHVYQAAPYVSPDTGEWVISNSTLLPLDGRQRAILHFEVALESFRAALAGSSRNHTTIVDADTGKIVLDLDHPLTVGGPLGDPDDPPMRSLAGRNATHGFATIGADRVAFQRVPTIADNANHWLVVTTTPLGTRSWWSGFGLGPVAMLLAGVFVLVFAWSSWRNQRRLLHAAVTDGLTGLPNRTLLYDRIGQGNRMARRREACTAVLLIDLDRFKEVNDTLGHHKGDLLLAEVGTRLGGLVRDCDTLARLGGDEFAVYLSEIADVDDAPATAARLARALEEPFYIDGMTIQIGASIGIATFPADGVDADTLIQHADVAMYQAKQRHCGFVVYQAVNDRHTERRLLLATELSAAISGGQLVVHYQPKIDLGTGEMSGVEALVRWRHPTLGLIPPDEFVSVAEETGVIRALTMNVLDQALARGREWLDDGLDQQISVNLSARSLVDVGLPAAVAELLDKWSMPAGSLTLEITETAIIEDQEIAAGILGELHDLGIRLSIDDFGTGYFSLSGLRSLPIDEIKIDRGFVSAMSSEEKDAFIVRSTITLGKNLGFRVVAEGVEDRETFEELRALGCDDAQGFLMSRPLPPEELLAWLHDWRSRREESAVRAG
jgi:diguanylate cyclase (GGDEF)-like protein